MQTYFELRKRRELGEILSDTFTFARINSKTLLPILIKTTGVFFLINLFFSAVYQYTTLDNLAVTNPGLFFGSLLLMLMGSLLYYASASSAIYSFMADYLENKGLVDPNQITQKSWSLMVNLLLLGLMVYFILLIGLVFFLIPGIYLLIPAALSFPILIFRNLGKWESFKASFKLVSGYWWVTFGTLLVVVIVIGIISFVFSLPATVYLSLKTLVVEPETNAMSGDFIFLLLSTLSSAVGNLLSIFLIIAMGLVYFDLDEEKNKTGIRAKLEELG
ncbi:hypothetical protein [Algoriphagus confluentis]|uniref:Glycerophosphoryl diester phosphodiesterase membrane domain-containing protein n=1 Tax=Algoriphagus confluentis TaxID=1697556 RepID=A0ABQ6PIA5_9BACT|nr:hypothetical protein Aconfl_02920 [Algoriphagus confluentis]